ncbi:MAG TPA: RpiB/LacA/LacB family sugar-phosphate isomerase [Vicinamibacterales bacterium]|nr:RpiB/LacA/LacB family sugar-phosphate isomerase [Vicinamibacterales bacterium]
MRTFTIITEADARVLERGSTVTLAPGGHITPLAHDTLRERRVTVVSSVLDPEAASFAPVADVRRVAVGGDHTSVALKNRVRDTLRSRGLAVADVGTDTADAVDYPDIAAQVARLVARKEADAGIVIDGAGLGSAIAANKIHGIRAAMCSTKTLARYAREHNGANVLTLGSTLLSAEEALGIVDTFLGTPTTEPRYLRRLAKIHRLERG